MSFRRNGPGRPRAISGIAEPLERVAPGPWRSRGEYLDYERWPDRDRFLELDLEIRDSKPVYLDHGDQRSERDNAIITLRAEGMSYLAIADALGITYSVVMNVLSAVNKRARERREKARP